MIVNKFKVRLCFGSKKIVEARLYKIAAGYVIKVPDGFGNFGEFETFPEKTIIEAKKALYATKAFKELKK